MKKYLLYIGLNLLFFFITIYCLMYAGLFLNTLLIPESILWKNDKPRTDLISQIAPALLTLIEATLLIFIFYLVNRLILRYDYNSLNQKAIALKTAIINFSIILCILIYGIIYSINHP